ATIVFACSQAALAWAWKSVHCGVKAGGFAFAFLRWAAASPLVDHRAAEATRPRVSTSTRSFGIADFRWGRRESSNAPSGFRERASRNRPWNEKGPGDAGPPGQ